MPPFKKLAAATALAFCALLPTAAMAQTKPKVLFLSTAEWQNNGQNGCATYPTDGNGGGAHFIFGSFKGGFTAGSRQSTGSLLALYKAVGADNLIARPGVLSTDKQIAKANYFNGTSGATVQYPNSGDKKLFNATDREKRTDDCESAGSCTDWTDAMQQLDALPKNSVVVVQSGYQLIAKEKAETLLQKMSERKDLVFVLLLDTCDACSYDGGTCEAYDKHQENKKNLTNLKYFMDGKSITNPAYTINSATGWNLEYRHLSKSLEVTNMKSGLSAYKGTISMSKLQGHTTGALECVPKQNVIFQSATPKDGTSEYTFSYTSGYYCASSNQKDDENCDAPNNYAGSWPELNASSAYGLLIPFWQNNKGQGGACIYLGVDNNIFDKGRERDKEGGCIKTSPCTDGDIMKGTQHKDIAEMFASLPTGACMVRNEDTTAGVCDEVVMKSACYKCVLEETTGSGNAVDKTDDVAATAICHAKNWKAVCEEKDKCACAAGVIENDDNCCVCANEKAITRDGALCCDINETPVGDPGSQTCCPTDETQRPVCESGQTPNDTCCKCPTDLNLLPVCTGSQTPGVDCCKPRDPDPVCTEEELAEYCCDAARSECCRPCDPDRKENTICEDDQNPDLFCCTCKKPYEERPICKEGQVPADITKSGNKAANVVCCRLAPGTGSPVPVNNPWALGLLGAAVAFAATRRRRRK